MTTTLESPRVSVIIPTYNRADMLGAAIRSVLDQTYTSYEIIVADDGSTDDTRTQVASLAGPIRYLRLQHTGRPAVARNRGIAAAQGDLIAFLDDDDLWIPSKLERQIDLLDTDPAVGFVYSDVRFLQPDGTLSNPVLLPRQKQAESLFDHLLTDCFIYPSTVVVRRSALAETGSFDESLAIGEDYDLWLRLARQVRAGYSSQPLAHIRRSGTGISTQREVLSYLNAIRALRRVLATASLSWRQQLRGRTALARWHTHVGLAMLRTGDRVRARAYFARSLLLNPLQRRAWTALVATYTAGSE